MKITYDEGVFEELVNLSAYLAEANKDLAHAHGHEGACNYTSGIIA